MVNKDIDIDIASKLEKLNKIIDEYKKDASVDVTINDKMEMNFNRNDLILKWLDRSIKWKIILDSSKHILAKIVSKLNDRFQSDALYNMTEKSVNKKIEGDDEYQSCKKYNFILEIVYSYCVEIMAILKSQQFEIKNKLDYLKFVNGVDR